jgi:two-component system, OmpR family, response regulator RegX3
LGELPAASGRGCDDPLVQILIVEDDDAIAKPLAAGLEREGFDVTRVSTGEDALEAALPDLVLLDLRLPGMDGTEVCRRLRARSDVPIIVVTAKGEEVDRVVGLELGADDYIVKPFGFRELLARIRAVMRRARPGTDRAHIHLGSLEIDVRGRRAIMGDDPLNLTTKEFDLLALLASEPGDVVSRQRILREVWDTEWFGPTKTVDVHVASLRKKLGDPGWIETVRGIGLRLVARP